MHSVLALELLGGLQGARNDRTVGNHAQVSPRLHNFCLSERDHEIRARISGATVGFAVQALVLQEQYGVIASNCGAQQSGRIQSIRRKNHPQPGDMGEDALAALRMIDRAAGEISPDRNANYHGTRECIVRAPANHREFVANLHHRRPDVVEELNLDYWLQSASGHAGGSAHNGSFGEWRIENPVRPELALQAKGQLENPAFALYQLLF